MSASGRRVEVGFFFSGRRRHTRLTCDWSSDVCSSDLICARRSRSSRCPARAARAACSARTRSSRRRRRSPGGCGLAPAWRKSTLEFDAIMESLAGKSALITGGARRVGAAIARRLHTAGAAVLIHYRDSEADATSLVAELNAARAKSAAKVKAELLAPIAPRALVAAALESFGRLVVLVNNASSFFPVALGDIESSHWEELIGSNLRAPLFICQQAAPELRKTGGAIVNIVDIHADRPLKGYPVYSIAKAGLAAMTRSLALELAPAVRVNAVAPGAIAWPEDGQFEDAERSRILATTPLARMGSPEDIAQAVHFLACAAYVTGEIVAVDGGRSIFI